MIPSAQAWLRRKHEGWNRKSSMTEVPIAPVAHGAQVGRSWGFTDHLAQPIWRASGQNAIEEDAQCPPLASVCAQLCTSNQISICTHHIPIIHTGWGRGGTMTSRRNVSYIKVHRTYLISQTRTKVLSNLKATGRNMNVYILVNISRCHI